MGIQLLSYFYTKQKTDEFVQILGYAAAFFTTVCNIPQGIKIIRTRETKGISTLTYSALLLGLLLWVIYGYLNKDWPVLLANVISALICAAVLILKLTTRKKKDA